MEQPAKTRIRIREQDAKIMRDTFENITFNSLVTDLVETIRPGDGDCIIAHGSDTFRLDILGHISVPQSLFPCPLVLSQTSTKVYTATFGYPWTKRNRYICSYH